MTKSISEDLRATAVRNICIGQVDHRQPFIGIDGNVSLAPDNLLSSVESALLRRGQLNRLAVDHRGVRTGLSSLALAIEHPLPALLRPHAKPESTAHQLRNPLS